jgi:hypothetical protein
MQKDRGCSGEEFSGHQSQRECNVNSRGRLSDVSDRTFLFFHNLIRNSIRRAYNARVAGNSDRKNHVHDDKLDHVMLCVLPDLQVL